MYPRNQKYKKKYNYKNTKITGLGLLSVIPHQLKPKGDNLNYLHFNYPKCCYEINFPNEFVFFLGTTGLIQIDYMIEGLNYKESLDCFP